MVSNFSAFFFCCLEILRLTQFNDLLTAIKFYSLVFLSFYLPLAQFKSFYIDLCIFNVLMDSIASVSVSLLFHHTQIQTYTYAHTLTRSTLIREMQQNPIREIE